MVVKVVVMVVTVAIVVLAIVVIVAILGVVVIVVKVARSSSSSSNGFLELLLEMMFSDTLEAEGSCPCKSAFHRNPDLAVGLEPMRVRLILGIGGQKDAQQRKKRD